MKVDAFTHRITDVQSLLVYVHNVLRDLRTSGVDITELSEDPNAWTIISSDPTVLRIERVLGGWNLLAGEPGTAMVEITIKDLTISGLVEVIPGLTIDFTIEISR